jgi:hypothetical protein
MSKTITKIGAQGDVLFIRADSIPKGATPYPEAAEYIVAHSETGHHHVAKGRGLRHYKTEDPLTDYLEVRGPTTVRHNRGFDTHETVELLHRIDEALDDAATPTYFKVLRQRQHTPDGWARVVD